MYGNIDRQASFHSGRAHRYAGPERRAAPAARADDCLKATLDEIDFGILLLDVEGRPVHANHAALLELDAAHPIQLGATELRVRRSQDRAALQQAIAAAANRGLRRQLMLGEGSHVAVVSVVPLQACADRAMVMIMLGKRRGRDVLAMQSFAMLHRLTPAETKVLQQLCDGVPPARIAAASGLAVSTIRTQIASIRTKTDTTTIRQLLQKVVALPPLVCVLRSGVAGDDDRPPATF